MSTLDGDQIFNESNNRYNYIKWKEYKSIFTSIFVDLSRENLFYEASWGKKQFDEWTPSYETKITTFDFLCS